MRKPWKLQDFWKIAKWPYFHEKSLKMGTLFGQNHPLKMGMGFEAWGAHPCPTQIWVPPPPGFNTMLNEEIEMTSKAMSCNYKTLKRYPLTLSDFPLFLFQSFQPPPSSIIMPPLPTKKMVHHYTWTSLSFWLWQLQRTRDTIYLSHGTFYTLIIIISSYYLISTYLIVMNHRTLISLFCYEKENPDLHWSVPMLVGPISMKETCLSNLKTGAVNREVTGRWVVKIAS